MTLDTRVEYAVAAANRGDFDGATIAVVDLIAEDWNNAEAHRAWGHVLLQRGKASDAVAAFRIALDLDPRRGEFYFDLVDALLAEADKTPFPSLTNWVEANAAIKSGLERSPGDERGMQLRSQIAQRRQYAAFR